MTPRLLLAALGLLCLVLPARADGEVQKIITPADKVRLDKYGETRKAALAEAKAGDPAEVSQLYALLAKPIVAFSDKDLSGNWQCRTIKVGLTGPLVIYGWFKCKVTDDGSGWQLEKVSGSQRTKGRFFDDSEKRAIYLGSGYVNDNKPKPYGSGPESDQVGYAFRTSANEWRIEFPAPYYESKLDIIEFKR
ncbi:DUF4893 domain-containing protein [Mesorhizobium sp. M1148]|uniref:DUF4893 domain-containing protein n=1 Tax=unclassified Mesorhizobium TaxID=325217 RepID=UPI0003CEA1A9|nr:MULTISPECIES: DUF4893 domain-containing protein [unclassified Mesorhizobium]ESX16112.1 hypothetical protein X766_22680 [Mesorhizobium sp. LSJC255A00]ESX29731.1 hypothetical protein X765_12375 [Mesorhizobium sp. LSHC440B00]ESX35345.1 hypothetical protein X763_18500 [Mesorhizobium sp. LSHC432A00]ESX41557.1 hypothetical protein X764_14775 [Mesorhizobium sp. LSHC440A00]ESX75902.1 hypothetical protein X757_16125 [Mesorhizobium sp. LSHC414A00]